MFKLEEKLAYSFKDKELLKKSLTHSSFLKDSAEGVFKNNQRLEFLGDAILEGVISKALFEDFPEKSEGDLTRLRAAVVREESLASLARELKLGSYILLGPGEERTGGRKKDSILADSLEAIIGGIMIDGGYGEAEKFINLHFREIIKDKEGNENSQDYKTMIQEVLQASEHRGFSYVVNKEEGPDHSKTFYVSLMLEGKSLGEGQGKSKKEAEQNAAKAALERRQDFVF